MVIYMFKKYYIKNNIVLVSSNYKVIHIRKNYLNNEELLNSENLIHDLTGSKQWLELKYNCLSHQFLNFKEKKLKELQKKQGNSF